MLENFREIYNKELDKLCSEGAFEHLILSSSEVRAFVYEVCKACVISQPTVEADAEGQCIYCRHWLEAGHTKCKSCGYEFRTA